MLGDRDPVALNYKTFPLFLLTSGECLQLSLTETRRRSMAQFSRKITVFKGTSKYLATSYEVEKRASTRGLYVTFKPKGARSSRAFEDVRSQTVIVEGWDHPEFNELLRRLADAPVEQFSEGVSVQMVSTTVMRGSETKPKYQLEFEEYLRTLDPSRILLDTRRIT
jgi:hypothetical protein